MAKKDIFFDEEREAEKVTEEEEKRLKREKKREQTIKILIALMFLAFIFLIVSFIYEGALLTREATYPDQENVFGKAERFRKPPVKRLYTLFPSHIAAYATKARHNLSYSQGLQAEAIYEPEDMNLQLATPMTVYCLLTVWESDGKAIADIEKTSREYFVNSQKKTIGKNQTVVTVGYNQEKSRYFVGYQKGKISLKIFSIYTQAVPVEKKNELKYHGEKVALEVINHMSKRVTGGE